jgi:transposase-like protein
MRNPNHSQLDSTTNRPSVCPACTSVSVTTTSKHPDVNSYWRCEQCGEVWNISRRHEHLGSPWR